MDHLPVRLRLTLAFTIVMAAVLAAAGAFLYLRLGSSLDRTIDRDLRTRAADIAALAQQADTGLAEARRSGVAGGFAQILSPRGTIIDATTGVARHRLLTRRDLAHAIHGPSFFTVTVAGERLRLLATPVHAQDSQRILVAGASLKPRTEALADLQQQLLIGGPMTLLLASLAGYFLAAAALRPVDAMSERAASISGARPDRRLPVPRGDDELARLGRRLNDMLDRLEGALERERSLVANASHELRTPLALMKTEIELALAEPASAPALAVALRSAGEETDRLAQLADDLLLLARIDSGTLPLRRSPIVVRDVLEAIALRFRQRADDSGRAIEVTTPSDLTLLADRRRLEQALSNLLENAFRHGRGKVILQASARGCVAELLITDEGDGFAPSLLPRAFDRFSRGESTDGGVGLGLAIVLAVARAHGGEATAANTPTGGARITLALPLPPRNEEHATRHEPRAAAAPPL